MKPYVEDLTEDQLEELIGKETPTEEPTKAEVEVKEAYVVRDEQTAEKIKPPTLRQEAEAKFKEVDEAYQKNPTQELLTARLYALAELMRQ